MLRKQSKSGLYIQQCPITKMFLRKTLDQYVAKSTMYCAYEEATPNKNLLPDLLIKTYGDSKRFDREASVYQRIKNKNYPNNSPLFMQFLGKANGELLDPKIYSKHPLLILKYKQYGFPMSKLDKSKQIIEVINLLKMLSCLLQSLAFLHSLNIVHNDIEERNIWITKSHAILYDFDYAYDPNHNQDESGRTKFDDVRMLGKVMQYAYNSNNLNHQLLEGFIHKMKNNSQNSDAVETFEQFENIFKQWADKYKEANIYQGLQEKNSQRSGKEFKEFQDYLNKRQTEQQQAIPLKGQDFRFTSSHKPHNFFFCLQYLFENQDIEDIKADIDIKNWEFRFQEQQKLKVAIRIDEKSQKTCIVVQDEGVTEEYLDRIFSLLVKAEKILDAK